MASSRFILQFALILSLLALNCGDDGPTAPDGNGGGSEPLTFQRFHEASVVVGQVGMTSMGSNASQPETGPQGLNNPYSAGAGAGPFYVADYDNNRVLGFASLPSSNGATATFALGQTDFESNTGGTSSQTMRLPLDCAVSNGELFVVDGDNDRVLVWKSLPTTTNAAAQLVMGQDNFTTGSSGLAANRLQEPTAVAVANGRVFVVDGGNHRVLIWNSSPSSNGAPADVVVGQSSMTTRDPGLSQTSLFGPRGVWTDGRRLIVADSEHARVLIWNRIPTTNGAPADVVVGAPDFDTPATNVASASTFRGVWGVASDGTSLFVGDSGANRILIFTPIPTENGASATNVIGQDSFTADASNDHNQDGITDSGPTERTLSSPMGVRVIGTRLLVADHGNHRVLIYESLR